MVFLTYEVRSSSTHLSLGVEYYYSFLGILFDLRCPCIMMKGIVLHYRGKQQRTEEKIL